MAAEDERVAFETTRSPANGKTHLEQSEDGKTLLQQEDGTFLQPPDRTTDSAAPTRHPKIPLRLILVVPFVLQVLLAVGAVGFLSFHNGQRAVEELSNRLGSEIAARIQERLDAYLQAPHRINQINAANVRSGKLDPSDIPDLEQHFWEQIQLFESARYIYYGSQQGFFSGAERSGEKNLRLGYWSAGSEGNKFYTYPTNARGDRGSRPFVIENYDLFSRPWYRAAIERGKPAWGDIYTWSAPYLNLALPAVLPLYGENGELEGVFGVDLSLLDISTFLQNLEVGYTGETFIVERNGLLVASSTEQLPFVREEKRSGRLQVTRIQDPLVRATARELLARAGRFENLERTELNFRLHGRRQLVQVMPYRNALGLDWLIVVVVPERDFMGQIRTNTNITIALCVVAFAIATIVGVATSHWITQPILRIGRASRFIAEGRLVGEVLPPEDRRSLVAYNCSPLRINELQSLSDSFQQMAGQLQKSFTAMEKMNQQLEQQVQERTARLQEAEAELRGLFEAMTELIFVRDREGRYLKIVSGAPDLLPRPAQEMLNKTDYDFLPQERADDFVTHIQRALDEKQTIAIEYELTLHGKTVWFVANITPVASERVIWVARDISDRKEAVEALREKERYLRLILDNIPQQVFGKIRIWYSGAATKIGRRRRNWRVQKPRSAKPITICCRRGKRPRCFGRRIERLWTPIRRNCTRSPPNSARIGTDKRFGSM